MGPKGISTEEHVMKVFLYDKRDIWEAVALVVSMVVIMSTWDAEGRYKHLWPLEKITLTYRRMLEKKDRTHLDPGIDHQAANVSFNTFVISCYFFLVLFLSII